MLIDDLEEENISNRKEGKVWYLKIKNFFFLTGCCLRSPWCWNRKKIKKNIHHGLFITLLACNSENIFFRRCLSNFFCVWQNLKKCLALTLHMIWKILNHLPLKKGVTLPLNKLETRCLQFLVEINILVLEKQIFKFRQFFKLFHNYLLFKKKVGAFIWTNLNHHHPSLVELTKWFRRRFLNFINVF